MPVSWPDVNLPQGWHIKPDRVPVPAVPQSDRAWAAEIRRRHAGLPPEIRHHPDYAADSPNWDAWFTIEHDLLRRSSFGGAPRTPPSSMVVMEDQEVQQPFEESKREDMARWPGLA